MSRNVPRIGAFLSKLRWPKVNHHSSIFGRQLTKKQARALKITSIVILLASLFYIVWGGQRGQFTAVSTVENTARVTWTANGVTRSADSNTVTTTINGGGDGATQCADGIDNDGDNKIDYPADPGCTSAQDNTETNPAPKQCADGSDNDSDGKTDFPDDPGCADANDDDEANTVACVTPNLELRPSTPIAVYVIVFDKTSRARVAEIKGSYNNTTNKVTITDTDFVNRLTDIDYGIWLKADARLAKEYTGRILQGNTCPTSPLLRVGDYTGEIFAGVIGDNQIVRPDLIRGIRDYLANSISRAELVRAIANYRDFPSGDPAPR